MNKSLGEPFFQFFEVGFYHPAQNGSAVKVIKDVSLKIEREEWVSIVGKNGSGKTTLSRLFCGLLGASTGGILIEGRRIDELKRRRELQRTVGYLFSNPENQIIYPVVEEDVAFGPTNLGFPSAQVRIKVDESLRMVGLEGYQKKAIAVLSEGEMKKVALAGILAMEPKAIILDEPFSMLDPRGVLEMVAIIKGLRDQGITVVSTMSSLEEAASAERVLILKEGEIILEGKFKEIISEKEIIENAGLDLPKMTQLIYRLREGGISIPVEILSVVDIAGFLLDSKSDPESSSGKNQRS